MVRRRDRVLKGLAVDDEARRQVQGAGANALEAVRVVRHVDLQHEVPERERRQGHGLRPRRLVSLVGAIDVRNLHVGGRLRDDEVQNAGIVLEDRGEVVQPQRRVEGGEVLGVQHRVRLVVAQHGPDVPTRLSGCGRRLLQHPQFGIALQHPIPVAL